ncbi:MAG: hypothetical protein EBR45_05705, partial [Betaproteobacteria bacterium]|nr:hypothetical protein [Betaproteobacteria bacterium]
LALRCDNVLASELPVVLSRTKQAFDLDADPAEIDRVLGALAKNNPGIRLPGTFDPFELAIRAILGQQVTVKAARTLVTRFVAALGTPISTPFVDLNRAFPSVHHIAGLDPAVIASLGIVRQRAEAIISLANAIGSGAIELAPTAEPTQTIVRDLRNWPLDRPLHCDACTCVARRLASGRCRTAKRPRFAQYGEGHSRCP